jgi:hypothetical protein
LFFFVFNSCETEKQSSIEKFKIIQPLEHQLFVLGDKNEKLLHPAAIEIIDDLMFVIEPQSTDYLFYTIDIEENNLLKTFGQRGQGPGDFIGVMDCYKSEVQKGINTWDPILHRMYYFDYDSLLHSPKPVPENIFKDAKVDGIMKIFSTNILQLSDTLFLALDGGNKRFSLFNTKTGKIKNEGEYPASSQTDAAVPNVLRNQAYRGMVRFNKSQQKMTYVSLNSEMWEIFKVKDDELILEHGNYSSIPEYKQDADFSIKVTNFPEEMGRNHSLAVTDDVIYILYQNYAGKEVFDIENKSDIILSFDWNGNPLKLYKLDCAVNNIAYDKKNSRMYALYDNPETQIIYFDMN